LSEKTTRNRVNLRKSPRPFGLSTKKLTMAGLVTSLRMFIKGWVITPKTYWDYTLALEEKDLLDSTALLVDRRVLEYLVRTAGLGFLGLLLRRSLAFGIPYTGIRLRKLLRAGFIRSGRII
jgi:hypothetical protein